MQNMLDYVFAGESQTLELKTTVRDPRLLANYISSFANAEGGQIVVGVKEPPEIVGVDENQIQRVYEDALTRLEPKPATTLELNTEAGHKIAVIRIERSTQVVLAAGVPFVRRGASTQPMAWNELKKHVGPNDMPRIIDGLTKAVETLGKLLEEQSKKIDDLNDRLARANSSKAKWTDRGIGALIGVVTSVVASGIWAVFHGI